MTSFEGLIRELFFRTHMWRRILFGSFLCYFLMGFGYLRLLGQPTAGSPELPPAKFTRELLKKTLSALPLGAFYLLVPMLLSWGVVNLLQLFNLWPFYFLFIGLGVLVSLSLTAVALVVVKDDPERFFLGLEFEEVLSQWWKARHVWIMPALGALGFTALCGPALYGVALFVTLAFMMAYLGLTLRNLRYS